MNPVVLWFASGDSLYFGAGLLLLLIGISPYLKRRWLLRCRNIAAWTALVLIVMACPPFPWVIDTIFLGAFLWWFIESNRPATHWVWARSQFAVTLLLLILPAIELVHRRMPTIVGAPSDHLVVIGDSISSGIVHGCRLGRSSCSK
jgi:hypothetical protein